MKHPQIGELWDVCDQVKVSVGNKIATYLLSGPGLVVGIHRNHDDFGDYYTVLFFGKTIELLWNNFVERIG